MTCHQALSLLEAYLDNELSPPQVAEMESHLATCTSCMTEMEAAQSLRELLKQSREGVALPEPGVDYWNESESLILARTVDKEQRVSATEERVTPVQSRSYETGTLMRSFMLFAASLVLMISALYLGSQRQQMSASFARHDSPVLITASLSDLVGSDDTAIVTKEEESRLVQGIFAIAGPGPVGRYTGMADLLSSY